MKYVGDRSRPLFQRVHRRDLCHPLPVRLLTLGQPRLESSGRLLRGLACRLTQIAVQHGYTLGVEAQEQQVIGVLGPAQSAAIEFVEVARRTRRQFLDLALGHSFQRPTPTSVAGAGDVRSITYQLEACLEPIFP